MPEEALTGWLATVSQFNPVTYLLAGLRSLIIDGWVTADLMAAVAATAAPAAVSFTLELPPLRASVKRG